ncbi:uncharacterized protein LOC116611738 isoform X1 [Nematostella vectensis]|uniref:uncharacterized protein LOC116611738 isoform X1 n=1 Tax=Nematostella vectensis TaxID=45351 RepID=UPI0020774439|nr:uncharacterized protein LOC116611738 isoform X1 [Nematostella vectensis]
MSNRCIVFGCGNVPSQKEGISLHLIPFYGDDRPEAKSRRRRWIDFVKGNRVWKPGTTASICSKHFLPNDFPNVYAGEVRKKRLKVDDFGVSVWPTVHMRRKDEETAPQTKRTQRMTDVSTGLFMPDTWAIPSTSSAPETAVATAESDAEIEPFDNTTSVPETM